MMNISLVRWAQACLLAILTVVCLADPSHAQSVSGDSENSGRVFADGSWRTPEDVARISQDNAVLEEYVLLREQTPDSFEGQAQLANWCQTHSLNDQRTAHLGRALMHNPENRRVRGLLGHVNINGTWYPPEQIENNRQQVAAARQRYRDWRAPVNRIARKLRSRSERTREAGLEALRAITDPRSVTALEVILTPINEPVALQALDAIDQFPQREATESIARVALGNPSEKVRDQALQLLASRNRYDFVPALIRELVSPVTTQFSIVPDSRGNVLYQCVLSQQNMEQDVIRQFDLWMIQNPENGRVGPQTNFAREASRRATIADAQIRRLNETIDKKNCLIQYSLRRVTGDSPGDSPGDWWRWWYDENEIYASYRPVSYTRIQATEVTASPQLPSGGECLVAGTVIWTELGPKAVESLQVGDRVLCEELDSHKLEYRTVLYPTRRPETPTFRIELNGETIQASGGHLFWVAGQGWTKTRHLRAGMSLRTATGLAEIRQIQSAETLPLYNLVVQQHANYFVGLNKILSHDSTILARGEGSVELAASR